MPDSSAIPVRILRRIEKLLALSGSPEAAEAAAAAAKAQDLLFRYNLRIEDLAAGRPDLDNHGIGEAVFGQTDAVAAHWQLRLATAVAKTSLCSPISKRYRALGPDKKLHDYEQLIFIGRPVDIELARLTLDYLSEAVLRLLAAYLPVAEREMEILHDRLAASGHYEWQIRQHTGTLASARAAYLEGVVSAIVERLHADFEARRSSGAASSALVVHREAALDDYLAARHGPIHHRALHREADSSPRSQAAQSSFDSGFEDGLDLSIAPPLDQLGDAAESKED
jgi:hypothetical protein